MTDKRHDFRQQRNLGGDERIVFERALLGGGPDGNRVGFPAHKGELAEARDVDQLLRAGKPHGHERHQCLSAGNEANIVSGRQQRASLVEVRGTAIFECSRFHDSVARRAAL